jgi:hypothetical protein
MFARVKQLFDTWFLAELLKGMTLTGATSSRAR